MLVLRFAFIALLLTVLCESAEENPFAKKGVNVVELSYSQYSKFVTTKNRKSHCILLVTANSSNPDVHCHQCGTVEGIIDKIAYNYQRQYGNKTDKTGETKVLWAKIFYDSSTERLPMQLGFRSLPALVYFKPKGVSSSLRFDDDPGRDKENKRLEELMSPTKSARKAAKVDKKKKGKGSKRAARIDKWTSRMAKRETQWNQLAFGYLEQPDDGSYNEKNILRFVERNTNLKINLTEDRPELLKPKKVLTAIAIGVVGLIVTAIRLLVFPAQDPNVIIHMQQARLLGVHRVGDSLERGNADGSLLMRLNRAFLPSIFWSVFFLLSMLAFLIVTGGFYYNILHPAAWEGGGRKGKKEMVQGDSHGQYGIECWLVAMAACAINCAFIVLVSAPRLRWQLLRGPVTVLTFSTFVFAYGCLWVFFLKKNPYFIGNMKAHDFVFYLADNVKSIIGEV